MEKPPPSKTVEKAFKAALRLLRIRPRSVREMTTRLRKKFDPGTCRTVIRELQERRLIDDAAFSKFWVENRLQFRPKAKSVLLRELLQKGVDRRVIEEALSEVGPTADRAMAERLFQSRRKRLDLEDPKDAARMYRYLRSRGFSHDLVTELLNHVDEMDVDG